MTKLHSLLVLFFLLQACASTHPGNLGTAISGHSNLPLTFSAQNIEEGSNEAMQLAEVTIENTSDSWIKIDKARVIIGDPGESKLSVVLGPDLMDWAQAASIKQKEDQHNKEMAQLGILGAGAIAALAGGKGSSISTAGAVAVVGGYSWILADAVNSSIDVAQRGEIIPSNHLYHPASIPPQMHLRRWVLLNLPKGQALKTLVIKIMTISGEEETYAIPL
jgi:hypothetical protein